MYEPSDQISTCKGAVVPKVVMRKETFRDGQGAGL